jgi:dTDP-4-amino-4,6-dideoxy-D-galactose acyltransferase
MGFPVARLALNQADADETALAIAECRAANQQLVYMVVRPDDDDTNHAVRASGAWLADRKITFAMPLQPADAALPLDPAIVLATKFTPELEALAWQSGAYSRFRLDPRLPATVFQRLYSQWLRNSLDGSIAQVVLTLQGTAGEAVGLLTLGDKDGVAGIGLLAVAAEFRGQRAGQRLVAEARRRAAAQGYARLQVVTQGANEQACRFYEKCGFELVDEVNIYHLWLD